MTLSAEAAEALFNEVVETFERGERNRAIHLAAAALEQGLDEPLVLLLAAEALEEAGRGPEGIELLRQAAEYAPDEAEVWYCLGTMLIRMDRLDDGLSHLKTALSLQPELLPALSNAAAVSFRLGYLTDAERYYRHMTAIDPHSAEPLAALAALAARRQDSQEARRLAAQALELRVGNFTAEMAIGRSDLIDNQLGETCARMGRLLQRAELCDDERIAILDLRAEALDALDRPDAAFADYQARNTLLVTRHAPRMAIEVAERYVDQARRIARSLAAQPHAAWRDTAGPDLAGAATGCRQIFLLSFPRSGTTLLEKVLASHSKVVTLEEVDHLSDISRGLLASDTAIQALARLAPEQAVPLRAHYWQRVLATTGDNLNGKILVDKLPLHTLSLPVIAKLFPQAKVLFALRDPRDVLLSCFRRRFQINPAMFELLDLQGAARFYHEVMNLAEISRALLPISVHDIRHEQVVENFEPAIRSVLEFMGLEWEPTLVEFAQRLPADPRTPSDVQLRRGLNASGLQQWRRYATQITPIMDTLKPWVRRYGYH